MAEITAGMVKELRETTDAPHDGMQEGADRGRRRHEQGRGHAARQARQQGEQGRGPRRGGGHGRHSSSPATASSAPSSKSTAKPISSPRTRTSWRSPAALAQLVAAGTLPMSRRCPALPLGGDDRREDAQALVGKIGENIVVRRFARLQAQGRLASYVHGGTKIGVLVDVGGGDETLGQGPGDAYRGQQAELRCPGTRCPRELIAARARDRPAEGARVRQAGQHRRKDGRGQRAEVPARK